MPPIWTIGTNLLSYQNTDFLIRIIGINSRGVPIQWTTTTLLVNITIANGLLVHGNDVLF